MAIGVTAVKREKLVQQDNAFERAWNVDSKFRKNRKPRTKLDPKERSWAHAYLRHAAESRRFPFDGARESMQILARYFEIELPEGNGAARRSSVAIELAKAIQAKTGIALPEARP